MQKWSLCRYCFLFWFDLVVGATETRDDTCSNDRGALRVLDDCRVVMAPSDLQGWGLFALKEFQTNETPLYGDVVIPISDAHPAYASGMRLMIHDYLWDSQKVGQQYEGQTVVSVISGAGVLCNGHAKRYSLLAEREPLVGDAGLTRFSHAAAGSFTLYHNLSFYLQRQVGIGEELLVNYGEWWFRERNIPVDEPPPLPKPADWLRDNGYCVDNLKPGMTADKGRGAFATRLLFKDSIVAPVPVLPLSRQSLYVVRQKVSGEIFQTQQLLLNYCFGHNHSSLLLYPYSPIVNLINHSSKSPNVKLQWAVTSQDALQWPMDRILNQQESPGLLLELVALRDIDKGEEIVMNYGSAWQEAWMQHLNQWKPSSEPYVPSFNFSVDILRTEKELRDSPYPDNIFTSCFYKYRAKEHESSQNVTMDQWKASTPDVLDMANLRPCAILEREGVDESGKQLYTVQIRNRFGLRDKERLLKGRVHIVTHVPRRAIRFSDKLYTTDPHMEGTFRHEIGLPSFPTQWMDLT